MSFKLNNFSKQKILVVGDVMLDEYWHGATSRISPEAPVPVVHVDDIYYRLGGAGNVALNLAELDCKVKLLAVTGKDSSADILDKLLAEKNIEYKFIKLDNFTTVNKLRVLSRSQQLIRLDRESREKAFCDLDLDLDLDQKQFNLNFEKLLKNSDVLILSDYAKGTLQNPQRLITKAQELSIPVIVDPKRADFTIYTGATVVTPNLQEFQSVVGVCKNQTEVVEKARQLISTYKLGSVIVTQGQNGLTVIPACEKEQHIAAKGAEIFDVTGAGDTVVALLAASLSQGAGIVDAAEMASIGAGIVVGKVGTSSVSNLELSYKSLPLGITDEKSLINIVKTCQAQGQRVVFTNGCYDILHHGHIKYLERARELGDRLIVGVNNDSSVARLKGSERPIHNIEQRMSVLASLKSVDWVLPFTEDTPGRLVAALSPDILAKSDEKFSSIENIPATEGVAHVLNRGGKVYLVSRTPDCSSTELVNAIKETV